MNRIRLLVVLLIFWLFVLFSIERPFEIVNISRVAYIAAALMAVIAILIPRWRRVPLWLLLVAPVPLFLLFKSLGGYEGEGYEVWGSTIPLTVTEICSISITTILAYWLSNAVSEFEGAVDHITIGQNGVSSESFSTDQAEMYQEVRRARHHQRPLSLVAIGLEEESIRVALDRMVQEAQQAMMKRYVLSNVARTLCEELEDYNLVAQGNGHFLILLPEVTPEKLADVIERLRRAVSEQVGVVLKVGTASFPDDAVTFESLVEMAVGQIHVEPKTSPRRQTLVVQHQPTHR